jgi:ATP-dependent exoDNAse (exonuclease V) alpha subunit
LWEVQVLQQSSKRNHSEFIKNLFKYTDKYQGKYLDEEYTIYSDFNDEKYLFYAQQFAVVDFVYAMTCHKAQGTTMKSVGVYVKDIWGDFNRKLFYTSITRAKQFAYILQ